MAGDPGSDFVSVLRTQLSETAAKCSERCLYQSAKWAAELLSSIQASHENGAGSGNESDLPMPNADAQPRPLFSITPNDPQEAILEVQEAHRYLLAKSYFDTREYDRCVAVFLPPAAPTGGLLTPEKNVKASMFTPPKMCKEKSKSFPSTGTLPKMSQKSLFLALYARYIAGEKRKDEESEMVLGPHDGGHTVNRELPALTHILESHFSAQNDEYLESRSQGWLEYLYGIVLSKSRNEDAAREWLVRAARQNPYHWGAWEELATLLPSTHDSINEKIRRALPQNMMTILFNIHLSIDLSIGPDSSATFDNLHELLKIFPTSTFLLTALALLNYHSKDFEAAAQIFQELLTTHPRRLDALDHFSNILYVMQDRPKLSFLAHLATSTDKFRPETCCVVGNYYSLCSQHEKAVMYFRRALTLDKNFLSAWTLMGHEYVETKNTHAAIESYRRAVDLNRKDYRAWYGLGQAYEVLDMAFYALFYYQRASALRPYDPKMWQAVGSCYSKMGRLEQSIQALKRALIAGTYYETMPSTPGSSFNTSISSSQVSTRKEKSRKAGTTGRKLLDPEVLHHIATLYEKLGNLEDAARFMELTLAQETGSTAKSVSRASDAARKHQTSTKEGGEDADDDADDDDNMTEVRSKGSPSDEERTETRADEGFGYGTTGTTSKARLWLARWALRRGDLDRADTLAEELCVDGFEVEEAKALGREVRGRRDANVDQVGGE